jgi:hypothetical protein
LTWAVGEYVLHILFAGQWLIAVMKVGWKRRLTLPMLTVVVLDGLGELAVVVLRQLKSLKVERVFVLCCVGG